VPKTTTQLEIEGQAITISNPDKVLYPANAFTKIQVIDYYYRVSDYLLPHLKDRPVTLKRYPDGVKGQHFYEKQAPKYTPEWVKTFPVPRQTGGMIDYILINDVGTLVWLANLANLEIHPFLHRAPKIDTPTYVVFDLDPGEGVDVLTCAEVSFELKDMLEQLGLESFAKVSGSKGMQLYVPLNTPVTYDHTGPFAHAVAELLEQRRPERVISKMTKSERAGKVFIYWSQNSEHKTTVAVYSLRAKSERPFVSMPVTWDQLKRAMKKGDSSGLYFEPEDALKRFKRTGDLFAPVLTLKQKLPAAAFGKEPASPLDTYRQKRDFTKTAEPAPRATKKKAGRRFVIQKHDASRLHYDFRLEMDGVLKSWAVPKGVPYAPGEKHLAAATEDHPIEYLDFEGTIPKGQYGGGTVMVWDIGTYELVDGSYEKGKLHVRLNGKKLKGDWVLVRTSLGGGKNWLLIKAGEAMKPLSPRRDDKSALTGRTMEQIARENTAEWQSDRVKTRSSR
jgi:bifunctional non-homologous end joining protein LigD